MIKSITTSLLTLALVAATPAFGSYNGPFVTKSSGGGFTPPEWSKNERCELYTNKVVITRTFGAGALVQKDTRAIKLGGSKSLLEIIDLAAAETVDSRDNFMCDGPASSINATRILPNDATESLTLFFTGGCGSPRLERQGPYTRMLRDIVDAYCTHTFDFAD